MKRSRFAQGAWILSLGVAMCAGASCSRESAPTGGGSQGERARVVAERAAQAAREGGPVMSPAVRAIVDAKKREMAWVGKLHHEFMTAMIKELPLYRKKDGNSRLVQCARLEELTVQAITTADAHGVSARTDAERVTLARNLVSGVATCAPRMPLNMFRASPVAEFYAPVPADSTSETFLDYVYAMDAALDYTDGSTAAVTSYTDAILAAAVGLQSDNYSVVAAHASFMVSSTDEWNNFNWSGGGTSCSTYMVKPDECQEPESIFHIGYMGWRSAMFATIGADALGCLSTVSSWGAAAALLGGPAVAALGGACGYTGALASGAALVAMT